MPTHSPFNLPVGPITSTYQLAAPKICGRLIAKGSSVSCRPWLGWLMVLDVVPGSTRPVRVDQPHFNVFPEFVGASYAKQYELLCRRLVRERKYDAACLLLKNQSWAAQEQNYQEPAPDRRA